MARLSHLSRETGYDTQGLIKHDSVGAIKDVGESGLGIYRSYSSPVVLGLPSKILVSLCVYCYSTLLLTYQRDLTAVTVQCKPSISLVL